MTVFSHRVAMRRREFFRVTCIAVRADGLRSAITYQITHRGSGGHHGEGSDAQQQRKEEAEAGQE